MCGPAAIPIATLVISVASTAASFVSARKQASAQAAYQSQQAEEYNRVNALNHQAAQQEYVEQSAAERMSQMQEKAAADQQTQAVQREALQKQGQMLASTNASGLALDYLLADYDRQEGTQKDLIRQQYEFGAANSDTAVRAYRDKTQTRIDGQQRYIPSPVNAPSFLGSALEIGAAGLGAWDGYQTRKAKARNAGSGVGG